MTSVNSISPEDFSLKDLDDSMTLNEKVSAIIVNILDRLAEFGELMIDAVTDALGAMSERLSLLTEAKNELLDEIDGINYEKINTATLNSKKDEDKSYYVQTITQSNQIKMKKIDSINAKLTTIRASADKVSSAMTNLQSQRSEISSMFSGHVQNMENLFSTVYRWGQ